jgi:hypothetical protein
MKTKFKFLCSLAAVALLLGGSAWAASTYVTKSAVGGADATKPFVAGATAIFPADPAGSAQIRVVGLNWNSDSNSALAVFNTGAGAYYITATNLSSSYMTQYVNSVVGMVTNTEFILEHSGVGYACVLTGTNNATNAIFLSGAFGVISSVGDNLYQLTSSNSIPIGATTNAQNGTALYVGAVGRPVLVRVGPSLATNRINTVTAIYE